MIPVSIRDGNTLTKLSWVAPWSGIPNWQEACWPGHFPLTVGMMLANKCFYPRTITLTSTMNLNLSWMNLKTMNQCEADTFMQNRALCHTAKLVMNLFEFCDVKLLTPWIWNAPDFNPIKYLWSVVTLQDAIQKIWDNINQEYLQNLADSLPKCLQMVKEQTRVPNSLLILVTSHFQPH